MLLKVNMHLFAAQISQLPASVSIEHCRIIAIEIIKLSTTQLVMDRLVGRPLQSLNTMPNLIPDLRTICLTFIFIFSAGCRLASLL